MRGFKILAILLIVAGALGLAYGGFSYMRSHNANLGPLELVIKDKERVNVPVWLSVTALVAGVGLLVIPKRR